MIIVNNKEDFLNLRFNQLSVYFTQIIIQSKKLNEETYISKDIDKRICIIITDHLKSIGVNCRFGESYGYYIYYMGEYFRIVHIKEYSNKWTKGQYVKYRTYKVKRVFVNNIYKYPKNKKLKYYF